MSEVIGLTENQSTYHPVTPCHPSKVGELSGTFRKSLQTIYTLIERLFFLCITLCRTYGAGFLGTFSSPWLKPMGYSYVTLSGYLKEILHYSLERICSEWQAEEVIFFEFFAFEVVGETVFSQNIHTKEIDEGFDFIAHCFVFQI